MWLDSEDWLADWLNSVRKSKCRGGKKNEFLKRKSYIWHMSILSTLDDTTIIMDWWSNAAC